MITAELRRAIAAAAGLPGADPGLRPTGVPGQYAASVALAGANPRELAAALAARLGARPWIAAADVSGPGYLTVTVTPEALAALPARVARAGPACAGSDALRGVTVAAPPAADPLTAATWEQAWKAAAGQATARLAAAAGATLAPPGHPERSVTPPVGPPAAPGRPVTLGNPAVPGRPAPGGSPPAPARGARDRSRETAREPGGAGRGPGTEVSAAVAYAGRDAVLFSLVRTVPGRTVEIDPVKIAPHRPGNPAYAVRYAHARAASGVRWAAAVSAGPVATLTSAGAGGTSGTAAAPWHQPADQGELALLDALSWLPERVAMAARRGRPDEFARYLEDLAGATITALTAVSHPGSARAPGTERLALALAARTGLAAGLSLLGVSAPDRL